MIECSAMKVRFLKEEEFAQWDQLVANHELGNIQQTSAWGKFQEVVAGRGKFWILGVMNGADLVGGALVVRHMLPKEKSWLYMPRGPLLNFEDAPLCHSAMAQFVESLKATAKKENAIFLRMDPAILAGKEREYHDFREIKSGHQPQDTLMVNLSGSEEKILEQMKQKGRYNIKLATKKKVVVKSWKTGDDGWTEAVEKFYALLLETTKRDGFRGHDRSYYNKMMKFLGDKASLYLAEHDGEVLAGAINTYFGKVATYYYGVSSNHKRNLMAPYLLHWQAMKDAKRDGFEWYDLFGIAPKGKEKGHAWEGVTSFKRKFGGKYRSYVKPQEYAFKELWYWAYRFYKWLR